MGECRVLVAAAGQIQVERVGQSVEIAVVGDAGC